MNNNSRHVRVAHKAAILAAETLAGYVEENPHAADYRIEDAKEGLAQALKALRHLRAGTQYPEWVTAMQSLREALGEAE